MTKFSGSSQSVGFSSKHESLKPQVQDISISRSVGVRVLLRLTRYQRVDKLKLIVAISIFNLIPTRVCVGFSVTP